MSNTRTPFTDTYEEFCKRSPLNALARRNCTYAIWPDQTYASHPLLKRYRCVILDPSADGGMPHTRAPGILCFPAYFPEEKLADTLRHELIHIDQRLHPEKWEKKLLEEGWTIEEDIDIPEEWTSRCRLNPDTLNNRFVAWEGRYIPLPLFERVDKPELRDIEVRWWDKKERILNPSPPTSYTNRYGKRTASEMEHPFELWAYQA